MDGRSAGCARIPGGTTTETHQVMGKPKTPRAAIQEEVQYRLCREERKSILLRCILLLWVDR